MNYTRILRLLIAFIILIWAGTVIYKVLKKGVPFEKALFINFENKEAVKMKEPKEKISDKTSCVLETTPGYTFDGTQVDNPRNITCSKCHTYVYKDDEGCTPYKYRNDGICVIDTAARGECPF